MPDARTGSGKYRIGKGRHDMAYRCFPHAARLFPAGHYIGIHLRHFLHAQAFVVMEVLLLHLAVPEGDPAVQDGGQSMPNTAFHLRHHCVGVDRQAAIYHAGYFMHPDGCIV